jgi:hypothetical protein
MVTPLRTYNFAKLEIYFTEGSPMQDEKFAKQLQSMQS